MRSRTNPDQLAEVARQRLGLVGAGTTVARPEDDDPPSRPSPGGPGGSPPPVPTSVPTSGPMPVPGRHARRAVPTGRAVAGWLHDRLPPPVQGLQLGSAHLSVIAVAVALALALAAWTVVRSGAGGPGDLAPARAAQAKPSGQAGALVTPTSLAPFAAPSPPGAPGATSTPAVPGVAAPGGLQPSAAGAMVPSGALTPPAATVVVDVAGRVRRPGIAELPAGSRVVDAVEAAGGARRGVSLRSLNLARVLVDGEQLLVGVRGTSTTVPLTTVVPGAPALPRLPGR